MFMFFCASAASPSLMHTLLVSLNVSLSKHIISFMRHICAISTVNFSNSLINKPSVSLEMVFSEPIIYFMCHVFAISNVHVVRFSCAHNVGIYTYCLISVGIPILIGGYFEVLFSPVCVIFVNISTIFFASLRGGNDKK